MDDGRGEKINELVGIVRMNGSVVRSILMMMTTTTNMYTFVIV